MKGTLVKFPHIWFSFMHSKDCNCGQFLWSIVFSQIYWNSFIFCLVIAVCDIVHDVETVICHCIWKSAIWAMPDNLQIAVSCACCCVRVLHITPTAKLIWRQDLDLVPSGRLEKPGIGINPVVRKTVFRVSDQVPHKPCCTTTQDG